MPAMSGPTESVVVLREHRVEQREYEPVLRAEMEDDEPVLISPFLRDVADRHGAEAAANGEVVRGRDDLLATQAFGDLCSGHGWRGQSRAAEPSIDRTFNVARLCIER